MTEIDCLVVWREARTAKRRRGLAARALRKAFGLSWRDSHRLAREWVRTEMLSHVLMAELDWVPGTVLRPAICERHPFDHTVMRFTTRKGDIEVSFDCCGALVGMLVIS